MFKKNIIFNSIIASLFVICLFSCTSKVQTKHEAITCEFIDLLEKDNNLKKMVEKSISLCKEINSDKRTNPAQDLESLYSYIDKANYGLPWNLIEGRKEFGLYEKIDQSVGYFYFIFDQPLDELKDKGYYYPSLQYHEPIASWIIKYCKTWGDFLSTEKSWNDDYYKMFLEDTRFNMDKGWYAPTNVWKTWNEFFAKSLISKKVRPISDTSVVAPADSVPQGLWKIDDNGDIILDKDLVIKSKKFNHVDDILGPDSKFKGYFNGGTLTHTFLDLKDYHRYHFPVSGEILDVKKIKALDAAGGITTWDKENGIYILDANIPGWQMIETRDCVIVDTKDYGIVAILPIGMSTISSCNFEDNVKVGAKVEKGDPLGYFLFGGSDTVMIFQKDVDVEMLAPKNGNNYKHILMGEPYANLIKK